MEQGSPGGIREAISDQWEVAITKPDDLYKVNHMLWAQAHDAKLERGTIRPSVPDNVADFLSSGQKILHADHLVNKDNQAELIYLFQATENTFKYCTSKVPRHTATRRRSQAIGVPNRIRG